VFENAGLRLELEAAAGPVFVQADGTRIAQVVGNLLQNAAKFTPRQGGVTVAVSTEPAARQAVIRVVDTGVGMTPEMLARLFEPFMQADMTLERSKGGLGLGLALVKGMVELHGGSVEAKSAGLGQGTQVVVRLPLDPAQAFDDVAARPRAPKMRRRVLVIEDNLDAADSLRDVLELEDHEVAVAHDGREGIVKARQFRPEVVLCDIGLPGMDGYEVARAFRADDALKRVFLVALSGYALPEDQRRAAEAGFDRHVAKPPSIEKLDELLGSAGSS
jgi:two-component system CheB/CheR fusion protein